MTEPNALDRLFNVAVPDKDVKRWLADEAEAMARLELAWEHDERVARRVITEKLTKWVESKHLTGRGTKKLVDKAVAKAMKTYGYSLWRRLRDIDRGRPVDDAITLDLEAGGAGFDRRERTPGWLRRSNASRGEKLASAFQQKNR